MIQEYNYITVHEIVQRIKRHPLLIDLSFEKILLYVIDFLKIVGLPKFFENKTTKIQIENYKGLLPCDIIQISQVREFKSKKILLSMSKIFNDKKDTDLTFKTQGNIIITSFEKGIIEISYKSIKTDENGFPMIIDNSTFLKALELYIKKEEFTILFDLSKISYNVLQNTNQQYGFVIGQLNNEFTLLSLSEMQSFVNSWNTLFQRTNEFINSFKTLNYKENLKIKNVF